MSQKRHSGLLGTRVGGLSAASLRINVPQALYELVVHSLRRYADRVVEVGGLPPEFESPVTLVVSRQVV